MCIMSERSLGQKTAKWRNKVKCFHYACCGSIAVLQGADQTLNGGVETLCGDK